MLFEDSAALIGLVVGFVVFFLFSAKKYHVEQRVVNLIRAGYGWRLASAVTLMIFLVLQFGPSGVPDFIYYRF